MTTEQAAPLEIDQSLVGVMGLGDISVPYLDLDAQPLVHTRLRVGATEYTYEQSYPTRGHSAVMPRVVAELQAEGRQVLVVERDERYYLYLAEP